MIFGLSDVSKADIALVGGKAAGLGEMIQAGIQVPPGFVVTTDGFRSGMTKELEQTALKAFDHFGVQRVAVRSSAVAEDSSSASWAGQLETYLNVGRGGLIEAIQKCWQSINSTHAKAYADENKVSKDQRAVAVVVQAMVDSEIAGVMFTANPVNNNVGQTVIETVYGLGELLVQGTVTPESLIIDKKSALVLERQPHRQTKKLVYRDGKNQQVSVSKSKKPILTNEQIAQLLSAADNIEHHYKSPQDIEWAINDNKLYIVQSRPITTLQPEESLLPDFFNSCVKILARPSTLQRDEIVRYTSSQILPIQLATIPLESSTRAYYLEQSVAKKLLSESFQLVNTQAKLTSHLEAYDRLKTEANNLKEFIQKSPSNYQAIFDRWFKFLDNLSPFLYVGLAVDKIVYPNLKKEVELQYPEQADKILELITTPLGYHDYQKQRLAICQLAIDSKLSPKAFAQGLKIIVEKYRHVNEYAFVESLQNEADVKNEVKKLSLTQAKSELHDIQGAIEQNKNYERTLAKLLPKKAQLNQALLTKSYVLIRTGRIDQLKLVQVAMREVFMALAQTLIKIDGHSWQVKHIANLLNEEINDFIVSGKVPPFDMVSDRISQNYLYYFSNGKAVVNADEAVIEKAKQLLIKPEQSGGDSLISPGTTAFKGVVSGRVVKINKLSDLKKVKSGDIMVARVTMPDYTAVMKKAAGFITAEGGITSHAAIIARELKKPCIVGSDNCMDVLREDDMIVLNANESLVTVWHDDKKYNLGKPEDLFYWGPSRAKALYMSDYVAAIEKFFIGLSKNDAMPAPMKTVALFHKDKVVWLINAKDFANFTQKLFMSYQKRNKVEQDIVNWQNSTHSNEALLKSWEYAMFAEFALYGAESVVSNLLERYEEKTRQKIWAVFTVPENATFMGRIDDELIATKDPHAVAKKYPWIQNGYEGVFTTANEYFKERLEILATSKPKKVLPEERNKLIKEFKLKPSEVKALHLTRRLAEFMDERKAWMMQSRRSIKHPFMPVEYGWFFDNGQSQLVNQTDAEGLWERYIDFKASSSVVAGLVASNGGKHYVNGTVCLISSPMDILPNDHIMVVPSTSPSYVPLMRKARALITDHGGMMSHAAIVARELGLPCIIGTKHATKTLKTGDKVVLDLVKGEVN
ncbi:MAG: PEP/pyruvate-binding domain-containing protein [Patescibacteria group bacterium]